MPDLVKRRPGEVFWDESSKQWCVCRAANPLEVNPCRSHAHALASAGEALVLLDPNSTNASKNAAIAATEQQKTVAR